MNIIKNNKKEIIRYKINYTKGGAFINNYLRKKFMDNYNSYIKKENNNTLIEEELNNSNLKDKIKNLISTDIDDKNMSIKKYKIIDYITQLGFIKGDYLDKLKFSIKMETNLLNTPNIKRKLGNDFLYASLLGFPLKFNDEEGNQFNNEFMHFNMTYNFIKKDNDDIYFTYCDWVGYLDSNSKEGILKEINENNYLEKEKKERIIEHIKKYYKIKDREDKIYKKIGNFNIKDKELIKEKENLVLPSEFKYKIYGENEKDREVKLELLNHLQLENMLNNVKIDGEKVTPFKLTKIDYSKLYYLNEDILKIIDDLIIYLYNEYKLNEKEMNESCKSRSKKKVGIANSFTLKKTNWEDVYNNYKDNLKEDCLFYDSKKLNEYYCKSKGYKDCKTLDEKIKEKKKKKLDKYFKTQKEVKEKRCQSLGFENCKEKNKAEGKDKYYESNLEKTQAKINFNNYLDYLCKTKNLCFSEDEYEDED